MALNTSTLRPGLMVSLKTSVTGNCSYTKTTLQPDTDDETGARTAKWETERRIIDPKEYDVAGKTRSRARQLVRNVCIETGFGMLCPDERVAKLEEAFTEAEKLVDAFNDGAKYTYVGFNYMTGKLITDSVAAVQAINSEVRDLIVAMQQAIEAADPAKIREAAARARQVSQMLSDDARAQVAEAIDAARSIARTMAKATETAAAEIDQNLLATLARTRTAFLDLEETAPVALPEAEARPIELEADTDVLAQIEQMRQEMVERERNMELG